MADTNIPGDIAMPDHQNNLGIKSGRVRLSLEATWEIEAMVSALLKLASNDPLEEMSLIVRGMGSRIHELNSIIMSAVGDDGETESSLHFRLFGEKLEAAEEVSHA